MKRVIPVVRVLLLAFVGLAWSVAAQAQEIDGTPCRDACQEERAVCVEACSGRTDPVGCDEQCDDEAEDCEANCRD